MNGSCEWGPEVVTDVCGPEARRIEQEGWEGGKEGRRSGVREVEVSPARGPGQGEAEVGGLSLSSSLRPRGLQVRSEHCGSQGLETPRATGKRGTLPVRLSVPVMPLFVIRSGKS